MGGSTRSVRVEVGGQVAEADGTRSLTIGRDAACDLHVDDPRVSRHHAELIPTATGWVLRDAGSRNGTFLDGRPITELAIDDGSVQVLLGDAAAGVHLMIQPQAVAAAAAAPAGAAPPVTAPVAPAPTAPIAPISAPPPEPATPAPTAATRPAGPRARRRRQPPAGAVAPTPAVAGARTRIGRASDNDLVLEDDIRASRHHAELIGYPDGTFEIADAGSSGGTFVNGNRITRVRLNQGDVVSMGNHSFTLSDGTLQPVGERAGAALEAVKLTVRTDQGSTILQDVSFSLEPGKLLAVVGPSGSGKSTLLGALLGARPATTGTVRFDGRDLYASFDDVRHRIGFVPQDDILHRQLKVKQALEFAAALRFPADVDAKTRSARVTEVMEELDLTPRANLRIDRLSGGQRKRVSVALELLTKPSLLFLDEPTSGLDPGNERQVMALLRELADGGRTVIVVTHSTQSLHLCDRVLFMAPGGRLGYYGPPAEALAYFDGHGAGRFYADVFTSLEERPDTDWGALFAADPAYERYVGRPVALEEAVLARAVPQPLPAKRQQPWTRQFQVLVRRYLAVIMGDRRALIWLIAQAPLFGILFAILVGKNVFTLLKGPGAAMLVWLLVVGATWLGASNAIGEIVEESPIYQRERSVGLSIQAYIGSKVAVLGVITVLECGVMTLIALAHQKLGDIKAMDLPQPAFTTGLLRPLQELNGQRLLPDEHGIPFQNPLYHVFAGQRPFAAGSAFTSPTPELLLDIMLAGLAAMALALLISALMRSSQQAAKLLPILLVVQIVVSQPFTQVQGQDPAPLLKAVGTVASAEWGKDAASSTVNMNLLGLLPNMDRKLGQRQIAVAFTKNTKPYDERGLLTEMRTDLTKEQRWKHATGTWGREVFALVLLILVPLAGAYVVLRRRDIHVASAGLFRGIDAGDLLERLKALTRPAGRAPGPQAQPQPATRT